MTRAPDKHEAGYALVALIAATTVMLILMLTVLPAWRYVMKNERELELIFRQEEVARAIQRYQARHNGALPPSLDMLVQTRVLRRKYKNPLSPDGRWYYVRPGEVATFAQGGGIPQPKPTPTPSFQLSTTGPGGQEVAPGPFQAVRATSTEKGLRVVNGREAYNEWVVLPGQRAFIGKLPLTLGRPGIPTFPQQQPPTPK